MELVLPLSQAQIAAADRLRLRLRHWEVSDRAFQALSTALPGFGPEPTLLKAVAVNQFYGTNVYAVVRMAKHVSQVMAARNTSTLRRK